MTPRHRSLLKYPETLHLSESVNYLFFEAVRQCMGTQYANLARQDSNSMHVAHNWRSGGDFETNFCMNMFRRHVSHLNAQYKAKTMTPSDIESPCLSSQDEKAQGKEEENGKVYKPPDRKDKKQWDKFQWPPLHLKVVSDYGAERHVKYDNPRALAASIVSYIPEELRNKIIADEQIVGKAGKLVLTTKAHLEWHLVMGRLKCELCGLFCRGSRGLRMHQMEAHGLDYEPAEKQAMLTSTQLIVFTAGDEIISKWEREAEVIAAARDAMHMGIEATRQGDILELKKLIDEGWNPHTARDRNGCTALNWAAGEGQLEVCKFLVDTMKVDLQLLTGKPKRKRHSLHWAARNGHIEVCEWLIFDKHVDPDIPTEDGTTPLHYACMQCHYDMCLWLVDQGKCDINRLNSFGCNASQWCALSGCVDIMRMLKDKGLDLYILNRNGHSVMHKAAMKGMKDNERFFSEFSMNVLIFVILTPILHRYERSH
jgi:hypothetical protein